MRCFRFRSNCHQLYFDFDEVERSNPQVLKFNRIFEAEDVSTSSTWKIKKIELESEHRQILHLR